MRASYGDRNQLRSRRYVRLLPSGTVVATGPTRSTLDYFETFVEAECVPVCGENTGGQRCHSRVGQQAVNLGHEPRSDPEPARLRQDAEACQLADSIARFQRRTCWHDSDERIADCLAPVRRPAAGRHPAEATARTGAVAPTRSPRVSGRRAHERSRARSRRDAPAAPSTAGQAAGSARHRRPRS
jgi:hypothetical protein